MKPKVRGADGKNPLKVLGTLNDYQYFLTV